MQDLFAWNSGTTVDVYAENNNLLKGTPHSYLKNEDGSIFISVANDETTLASNAFKYAIEILKDPEKYGVSFYEIHHPDGFKWSLHNVSSVKLEKMTEFLKWNCQLNGVKNLKFGAGWGCVQYTSRALWRVGVPTLPINVLPIILNTQLMIRQFGIWSNPYLISSF